MPMPYQDQDQDELLRMTGLTPEMLDPTLDPMQMGADYMSGMGPLNPALGPVPSPVNDVSAWAQMQKANMGEDKKPLSQIPAQTPVNPGVVGSPQNQGLFNKYSQAMEESFKQQGTGLDHLNSYINEMANRPQGVNWTPIAAFVDSMNPGAKFTQAAQSMAPQSAEQRDQTLFNLRNQLQEGKAALAKNQLSAFGDMAKLQQSQRMQELLAGYRDKRNDLMGERLKLAQDNQTGNILKPFLTDDRLKNFSDRQLGANRIIGQISQAERGETVMSSQLLGDINAEFLTLLKGGPSALGHLERTEYGTLKADIAKINSFISGEVKDIDSPAVIKQLRTSVEHLKDAYADAYETRIKYLKRDLASNPDANRKQDAKIAEGIANFGRGAGKDPDATRSGSAPEGAIEMLDKKTGRIALWDKDKKFLGWK